MFRKWKQVKKYPDIDDESYHRSYQQKYIIEKMMVFYKFMNIWM